VERIPTVAKWKYEGRGLRERVLSKCDWRVAIEGKENAKLASQAHHELCAHACSTLPRLVVETRNGAAKQEGTEARQVRRSKAEVRSKKSGRMSIEDCWEANLKAEGRNRASAKCQVPNPGDFHHRAAENTEGSGNIRLAIVD
jgi:hypothetical protein